MSNLYISDLHLMHSNAIKFDNRPFSSVEEMDETIVNNWNNKVKDDDTVYILGDFCMSKNRDDWINFLSQMNGNKILIKGNHDRIADDGNIRKYLNGVYNFHEIKDSGYRVIMCHYPIPFHRSAYNPDMYMFYGHIHNTREYDFIKKWRKEIKETHSENGHALGNFINVGCMMPYMAYTPRTISEIIGGDLLYNG